MWKRIKQILGLDPNSQALADQRAVCLEAYDQAKKRHYGQAEAYLLAREATCAALAAEVGQRLRSPSSWRGR